MKTLPLPNRSGKLTRQDKQAAVERTLYEIRTATTSLLQQIDDADPREEVELRAEATPERERGWHRGRAPSEKMKAILKKAKLERVEEMTFTQAGQLMEELKRRWDNNLCTFAQAKKLAEFGEDAECTFDEARAKLDAIARNGWKVLSP